MLVCLGGFVGYTLAYAGIYNHGQYAAAPWNALRGTPADSSSGGSSSSGGGGGGGVGSKILSIISWVPLP